MSIRIGVIGCGVFGSRHAQAIASLGDTARLVAVADPQSDAAARLAAEFPEVRAFTDYRDLLPEVDAVIVAAPHSAHVPIGRDALRAGRHVLMEKPLALTESDALELVSIADQHGVLLMCGYTLRFNPLVEALQSVVTSGRYGEAFHASVRTEQRGVQGGPRGWRGNPAERGGGILFSHGCHYVDLLLAVLGDPLRGTFLGHPQPGVAEHICEVTIDFAGGRIGRYFATEQARRPTGVNDFVVQCADATLELDLRGGRLQVLTADSVETMAEVPERAKFLHREQLHFLHCITAGERPITDARRALQSMRVIWRLYAAEQQGKYADLRGLGLDAG